MRTDSDNYVTYLGHDIDCTAEVGTEVREMLPVNRKDKETESTKS